VIKEYLKNIYRSLWYGTITNDEHNCYLRGLSDGIEIFFSMKENEEFLLNNSFELKEIKREISDAEVFPYIDCNSDKYIDLEYKEYIKLKSKYENVKWVK